MKTILFLFMALLAGCSQPTVTNTQTNTNSGPTKEQIEQSERDAALQTFLETNYKGWELNGVSTLHTCEADDPCTLHLVKGKESKTVTVMVRRFYKPDKSEYWFVYEPKPIELTQIKIAKIKAAQEEFTLENLTIEECQGTWDAAQEERTAYDEY